MKLTFIGSGSAFTIGANNYHSNMLLENAEGQRLLIDCGSDARHSLHEAGFSYHDIHDVYISHLHADHAGGLEWLGFTTKFDPTCNNQKPNLYISKTLAHDIWDKVLAGGLNSLQTEVAKLSSYFQVHPVNEKSGFTWRKLKIQLVQTIHVECVMPSFGLLFTTPEGITVFITTDTQFCPNHVKKFYDKADIIFQDCETAPFKSKVHAHYEELVTLPAAIKKKMWLYHYNPGPLPDATKDGFRGFVKKGQCFDFSNKKTY